ncbi:calcium-binding protein [Actinoplanes utahensis]|uniref:calcium-binding protein n=1 Tax=Actinoplanes utahensis TaxID=1869 RepID=UPI001377B7BA|nr:calcium-binding protein [Actinoplanes utahensis]
MNLKNLALGVTAAAIGSVTLLAPAAQAAAAPGTARVSGTTVYLYGGAGAANWITVTRSGRVVTFDDAIAITPGAGCKRVGSDVTRVACTTTAAPALVVVSSGDNNDGIFNRTDLPIFGYGGNGNDTLGGGGGIMHEQLYGGAGNDKIYGGAGGDSLYGGPGNDSLYGGDDADQLDGEAGADLLQGNAGDDSVSYWHRTGSVTVSLDGKAGDGEKGENDTIAADVENVWGGHGNDIVLGNAGDNFLDARGGKNYIRGGAGKDLISASNSTGNTVYGDAGDDFINGSSGNDIVSGGDGRDHVYAQSGVDSVYGDAGDDWLEGEAGNDLLNGAAGNDWLVGGAGDDKLHGGPGDDHLRGTGAFADDQSDTEMNWGDGGPDADTCYAGKASIQLGCE